MPPMPAPAPAPDVFKITFDALRPVLTELVQKGFDAKASADRRRRNASRVDARFEHATASLLEAARWALIMANKPGDEWKDLLDAAIQNAQVATADLLDPEDDVSSARFEFDDSDPNPSCPGCGLTDNYAPNCTCKEPNGYLAPELHDCALGVFIRAKCGPAEPPGAGQDPPKKPEAT